MTLLVFSDDWGRHPSSCQHLVQRLLPRGQVIWVNTIGMRRPKFEFYTVTRGLQKMRQWLGPQPVPTDNSANPNVVNPVIWPGYGWNWERSINRRLVERKLTPLIDTLPEPPLSITTTPTVADLIGRLPVRRWVYYCVDDFTTWPGLDHSSVERLEAKLIEKADRIVAVSEQLQERMRQRGKDAALLTHGVDLQFWSSPSGPLTDAMPLPRPWLLFWGLIDQRMDVEVLKRISASQPGTIILVGPEDRPDPRLRSIPNVAMRSAMPLTELPRLAASADMLLLPYADLPVTRAMQPLKLKEYLATGKPVVARDLPAVREWSDCLDLAADPEQFTQAISRRLAEGISSDQVKARGRLANESWDAKADQFYRYIST